MSTLKHADDIRAIDYGLIRMQAAWNRLAVERRVNPPWLAEVDEAGNAAEAAYMAAVKADTDEAIENAWRALKAAEAKIEEHYDKVGFTLIG